MTITSCLSDGEVVKIKQEKKMKQIKIYNGWYREIREGEPLAHLYNDNISLCGKAIVEKNIYTGINITRYPFKKACKGCLDAACQAIEKN
jgi:hypothetical protein